MKGFMLMSALMFSSLVACANPDYVSNVKKENITEGCTVRFNKLETCGLIEWINAPAKKQDSNFMFVLDGALEKFSHATLEVELWMPSMGHGSAPTVVRKINASTFDVSNVHFIMGGDWEIRFTLKEGALVLDEAIFSIDI